MAGQLYTQLGDTNDYLKVFSMTYQLYANESFGIDSVLQVFVNIQ